MEYTKSQLIEFSEQDTATKLVLPIMSRKFGFPDSTSQDFKEQRTVTTTDGHGRYDGLYCFEGFPIAVIEIKAYRHSEITFDDFKQARAYACSLSFTKPIPFLILSNGKNFKFFTISDQIDEDNKPKYFSIPQRYWDDIKELQHGEETSILSTDELIQIFSKIQADIVTDFDRLFYDSNNYTYTVDRLDEIRKEALIKIIEKREKFIKKTEGTGRAKLNKQIKYALNSIALHFTIKILFVKIIEDISDTIGIPKIISKICPRIEYNDIGNIFAYRLLDKIHSKKNKHIILKTLKKEIPDLGEILSTITWEDIFRYGFKVHSRQFGELITAQNYDLFYPSNCVLEEIRYTLIKANLSHIIFEREKFSFIGDLYEKLIDSSLKRYLAAVYTQDHTVKFMINLGHQNLNTFLGKKILEPACGSGHFIRQLYREYIKDVIDDQISRNVDPDYLLAHITAIKNIFGRDIDPFAIQLTLLNIYLEQLHDNVSTEEMSIKKIGNDNKTRIIYWLPDKSIDCLDSIAPESFIPQFRLSFEFERTEKLSGKSTSFRTYAQRLSDNPDIIIGNPPYGIDVANEIKNLYELDSNDSYGVFIDNSIRRLKVGGNLIFIVSSSFLTLGSHKKLRERIFKFCMIKNIIKLHRSTFPGIDVFPVIIDFIKCDSPEKRNSNFFHFYDLSQLHPERDKEELLNLYNYIVNNTQNEQDWNFDLNRIGKYKIRQGHIVECSSHLPIFDASPNIFPLITDIESKFICEEKELNGRIIRTKKIKMPNANVNVVELGDIANIKQGLITGDNRRFLRRDHSIPLGDGSREYDNINHNNILTVDDLTQLSAESKIHGIDINDSINDKYFVPYDKGGSSNIGNRILNNYFSPVEYFLDWSKAAVHEMRNSSGSRFQNEGYYFKEGITYSTTGIYSPTFRTGMSSVFDAKGSTIFCDIYEQPYLLGILCSKLAKYIIKSYLQHTVDTHEGPLSRFPLVIPNHSLKNEIIKLVNKILSNLKLNPKFDYFEVQNKIDNLIFMLYGLDSIHITEVNNWYNRRYPSLRRE